MTCDIHITQDGHTCDVALRAKIEAHVARLRSVSGPLQICHVVIDTRHKQHAEGHYAFVLLEIQPIGAARPLPSCHAIEDTAEFALDTVFALAADAVRAIGAPRTIPAHIVDLAADCSSGKLEDDSGRLLDFVAANDDLDNIRDIRVGDRAWLTQQAGQSQPALLLCPRRGKLTTVRLVSVR